MNPATYGIKVIPDGLTGAHKSQYTYQVTQHLTWIGRTVMGKILLNSIKYYNKVIEIRPYTAGDCNATADHVLSHDSLAGVIKAMATGGNLTHSVINYSPATWAKHGVCRNGAAAGNGGLWDEVLFHELVHSFRIVAGKLNMIGTDTSVKLHLGVSQYTDNEEFYAMMLQNIYIADKSNKIKTSYAGNHGFDPLAAEYLRPFGFYAQSVKVFDLMDEFCKDHKGLSTRVAKDLADAPFNPIAEYYADKARAQAASRAAFGRDLSILIRDMVNIVI